MKPKRIRTRRLLLLISCLLCSLSIVFPAGAIYPKSKIESTSEYLAKVALNHSKTGQYLGLLVEPKKGSEKNINDSVAEFLSLYGSFKEKNAAYISSMNAKKNHEVKIHDLDPDINYSFLHNDHGFGTVEYNGHFKTETYPLEVMFPGKHISEQNRQELPSPADKYLSFIYIPQSSASLMLDKCNLEHNKDNYEKLLGKYLRLTIDGDDYFYWIENIFFESNYFYDAIYEVVGDFLYCAGYPSNSFTKEALFFLRNYAYQNKYYIEYATSAYPVNDYDYTILTNNLNDDYKLDESKIYFEVAEKSVFSILIVVLSFILLSISIIQVYKLHLSTFVIIVLCCCAFLPYIVFSVFYTLTSFTLIFSTFSTFFEIILILVFVLLCLLSLLLNRHDRGGIDG